MRTTAKLKAAVLAGLILGSAMPAPAGAGTIKGVIRFAGGTVEVKKLAVTVDRSVCGTVKDSEDLVVSAQMGIANAVVSLRNAPPNAKWHWTPNAQMDQKQCVFVPRVIVVPAGATTEFLNSDRLLHNLHSAGTENPTINRTQPKGRTIPVTFRRPEIIRIDCDLHPWMRAWVIVAEHPFYAVTNNLGEFSLENVPSGTYTLQVWQESLGVVNKDVTVEDGVTTVTVDMVRK